MKHLRVFVLFLFVCLFAFLLPTPVSADDGLARESVHPELKPALEQTLAPNAPELVSGYAFTSSSGTYSAISGGTLHGNTSNDDNLFANINIGFSFTLDTLTSSVVGICSNGYIILNATSGTTCAVYTPISSTTYNYVMAAVGRDIESRNDGQLRSQTLGTAPNRVYVAQWTNYQRYTFGTANNNDIFNFQIRLYETTNVVEFVYGSFTASASGTAQVGLRGASNADFFNRTTTTNWAASTAGANNIATMTMATGVLPTSGLTYRFTPPPPTNTWLGNTIDWHTASNWSLGVVPSLATNPVLIPTAPVGGNFPTITAAAAAGGPLTIQTSANVAMTGGSLTLLNNLDAAGTFNATGGTTVISGTTSLSGTGSKTFYDLTVNDGAVLTPATAMTVNGTMTVNGEVSHNAGAQTYNGPVHIGATSVVQFIGAGNHTYNGPVTIDAGGEWATVFNTGIANFNSSLTNNGLLYVADTGTFNLNSDYDGTGRFRYYAGLGTINLAGSGARSVSGTPNFYNLSIAGAAVVNGSGSWTVFGNWTNNGSFNGDGTHTVTFAGVTALSGAGSSNFNHVFMGRSVSAGSHAFSVAGDWGRSGTFTPGTTTVTFAGGDQTIDSFGEGAAANSYSISPVLAVPDNGCVTNNYAISTLNVADSYPISDVDVNLTLTHTWVSDLNIYLFSPAGTLVALSTANGGNGDNYTNTTFDDEATAEITAGTAPFTGGYRPEGFLAMFDGENVNGTWELWVCDAASTDVGTIGSWSIAANAPLSPNGTGTTFYNMTVNNGSHVMTNVNLALGNNLMVHAGGWLELGLNNMTVEGTFANLGTVQQTKNTPAAATTEFLHIQNAAATVTKYRGVEITPAGAMGDTTVRILGNQVSGCSSDGGSELMSRCFDISPTTNQNATVRFYYTEAERNGQTANALSVWHFGTTWQQVGSNYSYSEVVPSCSSGPFCWMQADNITSFSPFGLGSGAGPTAVSLQQFRVAHPAALPLALLFVGMILVGTTLFVLRRRTA